MIADETGALAVLEAGCGNGLNLEHMRGIEVYGIDTNDAALAMAKDRAPRVRVQTADICAIPFRAGRFDLAISCTVLQHLGDGDCEKAISELYRVSSMYVLVMEYDAPTRTPVMWRGDPEGIIKRPWATMLHGTFKRWGVLGADQGFDDVSWWLVRK